MAHIASVPPLPKITKDTEVAVGEVASCEASEDEGFGFGLRV